MPGQAPFVGDHVALDLLNTVLLVKGQLVDTLQTDEIRVLTSIARRLRFDADTYGDLSNLEETRDPSRPSPRCGDP